MKTRLAGASVATWVYAPAEPTPSMAPLVVFLHAWLCQDPGLYERWMDHLGRRGYVVLFPEYQRTMMARLNSLHSRVELGIRTGADYIRRNLRLDADRMVVAGHSLGGALAADVAARAPDAGLPTPIGVMAVQPGRGEMARDPLSLVPLDTISPQTLMLLVTGEEDPAAGSKEAERIFAGARSVPPSNKNLVLVRSDRRGSPPLIADHWSPLAMGDAFRERMRPGESLPTMDPRAHFARRGRYRAADALHFFGYWKLLDALIEAAFFGRERRFALGNMPEQRFMGRWSNGVPVRELVIRTEVHRSPGNSA